VVYRVTTHSLVALAFGFQLTWVPSAELLDITLQPTYAEKVSLQRLEDAI